MFFPIISQKSKSGASVAPTPPTHKLEGPPQQAKPTLVSGSGDAAQDTPSSHLLDSEAHVATVNKFCNPVPTPTSVDPSDEKKLGRLRYLDEEDEELDQLWGANVPSHTCHSIYLGAETTPTRQTTLPPDGDIEWPLVKPAAAVDLAT